MTVPGLKHRRRPTIAAGVWWHERSQNMQHKKTEMDPDPCEVALRTQVLPISRLVGAEEWGLQTPLHGQALVSDSFNIQACSASWVLDLGMCYHLVNTSIVKRQHLNNKAVLCNLAILPLYTDCAPTGFSGSHTPATTLVFTQQGTTAYIYFQKKLSFE